MYFYHYFSKERGPFRSISDLPQEEAQKIWNSMIDYLEKTNGVDFKRDENALIVCRHEFRRILEIEMREKFAEKGGIIERKYPYYMRFCNDELPDKTNIDFYANGDFIKIPVEGFDTSTVSFTYGDSMQYLAPESYNDRMYWNKIYTYKEILEMIKDYGWEHDFGQGKPSFIEAQLWSDEQVKRYRNSSI